MFWGLIMEPNKRYSQVVEKPFHISQAAMDISTGDTDPCQVMVVVDGKNFLVCTLQKKNTIQVPLDLYFKTGDSVCFLSNGKCNVHLIGYLDPEFEDEVSDEVAEDEVSDEVAEEEEVSNEEAEEEEVSDEEAEEEEVSDEEAEEEEVSDEEAEEVPELVPAKNKRKLEKKRKAKILTQLQKFLDGEYVDTDDSFKVSTSAEGDDSEEDSDEDEEEAEDEAEEDEDSETEGDTTMDTSKDSQPELSKRLKQQGQQPQVNGVDKSKNEKKEKKSISGGVFIEDLKVGSGARAKPGKVVQVYYEGRLKSNNKKFDDCVKGPGFRFRLGGKEVIAGWDVGIAGMKVGGKRRIVCPANMAYGAKGSPPVIPANSTLVFVVELKNVK